MCSQAASALAMAWVVLIVPKLVHAAPTTTQSGGLDGEQLEPGSYELVYFLPGHYAAGQKLAFEVR
jgi:hypothetical protein